MPLDRRTFIRSTAALGLLVGTEALVPMWARTAPRGPARAAALEPTRRRGRKVEYDLTIDRTPIRISGKGSTAVSLNGSVPGPLLRLTEGEDVVVRVHNRLHEDTSVHWHGILLPNEMDGVPGVNFPGIAARSTFEYRFPIKQYGTYWYHSHSAFQEQLGHYAPLVIEPAGGEPYPFDRELIVVLSDWTFEDPHDVLDNLKKKPNYYNHQRQTLLGLLKGEGMDLDERLAWDRMRMDPTDISDITGATYTYLMNGLAPDPGWSGRFAPGERVRIRFVNASAGTFFDVRIPGLPLTVVEVNGQHVEAVTVDEFRMGIAETFDVLVEPEDRAYTVFAEAMDRSGYALGTVAPRAGMSAAVPARRKRPLLTMMDMGMDHGAMEHGDGAHDAMEHGDGARDDREHEGQHRDDTEHDGRDHDNSGHPPVEHGEHPPGEHQESQSDRGLQKDAPDTAMEHDHNPRSTPEHDTSQAYSPERSDAEPTRDITSGGENGKHQAEHSAADEGVAANHGGRSPDLRPPGTIPEPVRHGPNHHGPGNAMVPEVTRSRLHEPGLGLGEDGWRVLAYADLRSLHAEPRRAPDREIELHLTGNMERFMWSIDGKTYAEEPIIPMTLGERLRLTMVNDTMMNHPMHLHGMWMELENGHLERIPRVHTVVVKPAERLSVLIEVDALGPWAFHCHVLYHMEMGMFRVAMVQRPGESIPEDLVSK